MGANNATQRERTGCARRYVTRRLGVQHDGRRECRHRLNHDWGGVGFSLTHRGSSLARLTDAPVDLPSADFDGLSDALTSTSERDSGRKTRKQ